MTVKIDDYCTREAKYEMPISFYDTYTYFLWGLPAYIHIPYPNIAPPICEGTNKHYEAYINGTNAPNNFIMFYSAYNILYFYTEDSSNAGTYDINITLTIT